MGHQTVYPLNRSFSNPDLVDGLTSIVAWVGLDDDESSCRKSDPATKECDRSTLTDRANRLSVGTLSAVKLHSSLPRSFGKTCNEISWFETSTLQLSCTAFLSLLAHVNVGRLDSNVYDLAIKYKHAHAHTRHRFSVNYFL